MGNKNLNIGSTLDYQKQNGFTLIELLVSISIIAILSTFVIWGISDAKNKNSDVAVKQALASIPAQAELYANANGFKYYVNNSNYLCHPTATGSAYKIVLGAARNAGLSGIIYNGISIPLGLETSLDNATCNSVVNAWATEVPLKNKNVGGNGKSAMFCVDSTGFVGTRSTSMGDGGTACPAL